MEKATFYTASHAMPRHDDSSEYNGTSSSSSSTSEDPQDRLSHSSKGPRSFISDNDNDSHNRNNKIAPAQDQDQEQGPAPSALELGASGIPLTPALSHATSTAADNDFPDGGWAAWSCVFGAWCIFISTFGQINCAGIYVQVYKDDLLREYSVSTVTWIPALQACIMDVATAGFGRAFDSYGPRWLLYSGTVIFIFGLMMTSLSSQYYQFILAQGIVAGLGASCLSTTGMSCIMTWFKKNRASALGIAVSGSALGGVIMPIMLTQLIPRIGFAWAIRTVGLMCFTLCAIGCVLVTSRLKPKPEPLLLADYTTPFADRTVALVFAGCFLFFGGMFVPFNYIVVQARDAGFDPQLVPFLLPIMSACSIPGRIIPGLLADIIGRFNTTILLLGLSGIFTIAIWLPGLHTLPALLVYVLLYGFTSGSIFGLAPAVIAQVSRIREIGTRTGIAFALGGLGTLVSPPIAGAILDAMGGKDYSGLQVFCGVEMLAGMACFAVARVMQAGVRWTKV